jgi:predicted YcjX-like family ATPase
MGFRRPDRITRIAFVASKADQVRTVDRDKLLRLLRSMVEHRASAHTGLASACFISSSVVSTRTPAERQKQTLIGRLKSTTYGEAEEFAVSTVPDDWPEEWAKDYYRFVDVLPDWPKNKDYPPRQMNLDTILDFIMR